MFEGRSGLTVWIRYFDVVQPFAHEEGFAVYLGCDLAQVLNVTLLHGKDQVGLMKQLAVDLARPMTEAFQAVFLQDFVGGFVHGISNQGTDPRRTDRAVRSLELVGEQDFGNRTPADVAHTDDQDVVEHGQGLLPFRRAPWCSVKGALGDV